MTIVRQPNESMRHKSRVVFYHAPGGGGFMWAVATSKDKTLDLAGLTIATLDLIDKYLKEAGLDRTRIVKAEIIVTDHNFKPAFDEIWSEWMPIDQGPVRSFVQSVMPEGDQIEIIVTAALPHDCRPTR